MEFLHKLLKKIFSFMAHAALTIIGLLGILASLGAFISGEIAGGGIVLVISLALTAFGTRSLWYDNYRKKQEEKNKLQNIHYTPLSDSSSDTPVNDFISESYEKAVGDYNALNSIIRQLQDQEMTAQLEKMQGIAQRMLGYMREHPEKISLAGQFIDYYQDRALSLSRQFLEFEQMNLNTPEVTEVKAKTKVTLSSFDEAYEAQFSRMVTDKILDMSSELKVAEQIMLDAGIQNTSRDIAQSSPGNNAASTNAEASPHSEMPGNNGMPFYTEAPAGPLPLKNGCGRGHGCPRGRFQK